MVVHITLHESQPGDAAADLTAQVLLAVEEADDEGPRSALSWPPSPLAEEDLAIAATDRGNRGTPERIPFFSKRD